MSEKFEFDLITEKNQLIDLMDSLDLRKRVVLDTESTSLNWFATLLGITVYQKESVLPSFVVRRTPFFKNVGVPLEDIVAIMNTYMTDLKAVFHNAKYDMGVFSANNLVVPHIDFDTLLAIHLYDADLRKNLEQRVFEDFGYAKKQFKDIVGMKWDKIPWNKDTHTLFSLEQLGEYAAEDGFWTDRLVDKYEPLIDKMEVRKVLERIEIPLCDVLMNMKKVGVGVDIPLLRQMRVKCAQGIRDLEEEIYYEANCHFNINSGKQLGEVLYDKIGLPVYGVTKGGARATDKKALNKLITNHDSTIAKYLVEYSRLQKLQSGYIEAIPELVDKDGRLRCEFHSVGARTGRFSSSDPNLQNQPNNQLYPVRKAFIPRSGYKFIVVDWSQIELRVAAHLSKDPKLQKAFIDGRDIHQEVADRIGCTRDEAKKVNFGILYGLGAASLGEHMHVRKEIAQKYLNNYESTYTGITRWKQHIESVAKSRGFVRNMFGRIRPVKGVYSKESGEFFTALRQAVNTMIQGACADLMKLGMIRVHRHFKENNIPAAILLTVHDELVIECRNDYCLTVFDDVKRILENIVPMDVPIIAEGKICDNWGQMKDKDFEGLHEISDTVRGNEWLSSIMLFWN